MKFGNLMGKLESFKLYCITYIPDSTLKTTNHFLKILKQFMLQKHFGNDTYNRITGKIHFSGVFLTNALLGLS